MKWTTYWRDIVQKHHVIVDGWPENIIPFANLSTASSNLSKLELLLIRWIRGSTQFRKLSDGEFAEMEESEWFRAACKACGVRKSRSDKGKLRGRQPYPESRSKRLRHYAIKSAEFVDSEDEQDVPAEC
ncbi:hypothetical protein SCP_1002350 [Sparassis crispa]|uniref:Uncharacterized protein n=1 Tax=Sparassis crispa TaxID=139825 RepID=A0A401GXV3_9APHY|nr:hypothetical protein SCP_1002350 [Sparassis crispa]GBE86989.1 hypothetical protein SCP_1002350 [Sparassis crispa]